MKRQNYSIIIGMVMLGVGVLFSSCSKAPSEDDAKVEELALRERVSGTIAKPGEVDWYHFRANEANAILQVNCSSNTLRPDEELLVSVYEEDAEGRRKRLLADHAPEGSLLPAEITLNVSINTPKDIYIAVRDLMDDEASANPYYLTLDFAQGAEGNETFAQAEALSLDNPSGCRTDSISSVGDIDCFRFTAPEDGVYELLVDFNPFSGGTEVVLSLDLYDSQGVALESLSSGQGTVSGQSGQSSQPGQGIQGGEDGPGDLHLLSYLPAGDYYVLLDDFGRDDFDAASTYSICLSSLDTDEANENDSLETATTAEYNAQDCSFSLSGSLDYIQDQDWYLFPLGEITVEGCKVLSLSFDDQANDYPLNYQITLGDGGGKSLLSHSYRGGSSVYQAVLKAGEGDHYLSIQPGGGQSAQGQPAQGQMLSQKAPYLITLEILDVLDSAEEAVKIIDVETGETALGNNAIDTADLLVSDVPTAAKIGYRGDVDWYRIALGDTSKPKVLEVFLDTNSQSSKVDYSLSLIRDEVIKKVYDGNGEVNPAELKTSILVPAVDSQTALSYYFLIGDYQGDDGDGLIDYLIQANVRDIPENLTPDPAINAAMDGNCVLYYSELYELEDTTATSVKLEHTSLVKKDYLVNTDWLDFHDPNLYASLYDPNSTLQPDPNQDPNQNPSQDPNYDPNENINQVIVSTSSGNLTRKLSIAREGEQTSITFPWIAGYIDFQGDQDWFELDLSSLSPDGNQPAAKWYYDLKVEFHVGSPGSEVEYVWKLYRDRNQNRIMVDRPRDSDGFMASAGDLTTTLDPLDLTTPAEGSGQSFWVGDDWQGKFYLSISDFNYVNSSHPDDDWGYTGAPYYFRLTLVYHPGVSYP